MNDEKPLTSGADICARLGASAAETCQDIAPDHRLARCAKAVMMMTRTTKHDPRRPRRRLRVAGLV